MVASDEKEKISFLDLLMITIGCGLYALGFVKVNMANSLAEGGVTGITLIVRYWLHIDPAYTTLALNIPLILIGWRYLGKRALIYTIYGTAILSAWIWVWQRLDFQLNIHHDMFIAGILAGLIGGLGSGIVYRFNGTTGGSDVVARIFEKERGVAMGKSLLAVDTLVLVASLSYIDTRKMMYTLLASYVFSRVVNFTLEGAYAARGMIIISQFNEAIAQDIMKEMDRGVTYLDIEGGYSREAGRAIYCVVSPGEIITVKRIIARYDKRAFISIMDVAEVTGEGFTYRVTKKRLFR
ncbi:YitT family protein [Ligilactobacillus agilis]|uniref:YitT family protein n=1 Tax=Ligilactobacillus agilis TaxID=1601 RepID=UPI001D56D0B4|nr:YitT family protein [Ligilactobacillus agilis]HJG05833.1 YitT family protein [Ligilactobacillus agilis]